MNKRSLAKKNTQLLTKGKDRINIPAVDIRINKIFINFVPDKNKQKSANVCLPSPFSYASRSSASWVNKKGAKSYAGHIAS